MTVRDLQARLAEVPEENRDEDLFISHGNGDYSNSFSLVRRTLFDEAEVSVPTYILEEINT